MKRIVYLFILMVLPLMAVSQPNASLKNLKVSQKTKQLGQVVIGSSAFDGSAILTVTSTTQGALMPRMNTAERDAISSPADGLLIFNNQTNQYEFFETTWQAIGGGGNTIYSSDDNLAGNRIVTMGANSLLFSGNQTTFRGIDATSSNKAWLAQDNVFTDLMFVRNDGAVSIGVAIPGATLHLKSKGATSGTFAMQINNFSSSPILHARDDGTVIVNNSSPTGSMSTRGKGTTSATFSLYCENSTPLATFFVKDNGDAELKGNLRLSTGVGADNNITFFDAEYKMGVAGTNLRITSKGSLELKAGSVVGLEDILFLDAANAVKATFETNTGDFGIGTIAPSSKLDVVGDVEINSTNAFYLGDPGTDGTWRIIRSGDDLLMQQREAGVFNTKQTISGA